MLPHTRPRASSCIHQSHLCSLPAALLVFTAVLTSLPLGQEHKAISTLRSTGQTMKEKPSSSSGSFVRKGSRDWPGQSTWRQEQRFCPWKMLSFLSCGFPRDQFRVVVSLLVFCLFVVCDHYASSIRSVINSKFFFVLII